MSPSATPAAPDPNRPPTEVAFSDVVAASERIRGIAHRTPIHTSRTIDALAGGRILLKCENFQRVGAFKFRGAYNALSRLNAADRARGVVTFSSGNHAQAIALSGSLLGIATVIVMPADAPPAKIAATRGYLDPANPRSRIVLYDRATESREAIGARLAEEEGLTVIPPYDHPDVIAGQGTVAMEILRQHPRPLDAIFVPVGGGGLIAGVAAYVKALYPETRIIGVEPDEAPSMQQALAAGERIKLERIGIFADGAAVRQVGVEPFAIAQRCVDEVLTVSIDEICAAVKDIFEDTRSIAEPAGALALAGLKQYVQREGVREQELVAILSGANVNFDRLRHIAELAELGERREVLIGATIPERPGSFREFCHALGPRLITEFNYRYADAARATVFAGVQVRDRETERRLLIDNLREKGYEPIDMTDDEVAKLHVRFMVGGHGGVADERLLRFEFPERPGALMRFLNHLGGRWNITLFHYRNHGAAYGRVLIGVQVPAAELAAFERLVTELDMRYEDETANPAYRLFLQ